MPSATPSPDTRISAGRDVAAPAALAWRIAADVESYPRFVPGFRDARIIGADADGAIRVRNAVGWGAASAVFASRARLSPPDAAGQGRIVVESHSPALGDIRVDWEVAALDARRARVRFSMAVNLRSAVAQLLFQSTARVMGDRVIEAFRARAEAAARMPATVGEEPLPRFATAAALAALLCLPFVAAPAPAGAQDVDPLAGHYAEGGGNKLPRAEIKLRRELFLEPAAREQGTPGINCDHLKERKPQAIAGEGHVVLVSTAAMPVALRIWFPPGAAAPAEGWSEHGRQALAREMPGETVSRVVDRAFAWCK